MITDAVIKDDDVTDFMDYFMIHFKNILYFIVTSF